MKQFIVISSFFLFLCSASLTKAADNKQTLDSLEQKIKTMSKEEQDLKRDASKAQKKKKKSQKSLVKIGAAVQKNQSNLHQLEKRLAELRNNQKTIKAELTRDRESLAETIVAIQRLEKTPPQAMIAKPGAPIDTARGAMILQNILPVLHEKAQALKNKSEQYSTNENELLSKQTKLVSISKDLQRKETKLQALVDTRKENYALLNKDLSRRSKEIALISKEAKGLSDLVKRLDDERTRNAQRETANAAKERVAAIALPQIGVSQLPLRGLVRTKFNQKDDFGGKSKGVSIEGRGGALIVAPMGGVVRFAGYFKNFGNMIILEHKNGYHSLIAGLEKIDTVVDQSIVAGEPIGNLYRSKNGKPPTLYFELRLKGKSINPARKFTELG